MLLTAYVLGYLESGCVDLSLSILLIVLIHYALIIWYFAYLLPDLLQFSLYLRDRLLFTFCLSKNFGWWISFYTVTDVDEGAFLYYFKVLGDCDDLSM